MSTTLSDADVAALLRIAGEVGELVHDVHVRRGHILERLLSLIGGYGAVCSEMNPCDLTGSGWAIPGTITPAGAMREPLRHAMLKRYLTGSVAALDPCVPQVLRRTESTVTMRRVDVMDNSWFSSDHFNEIRRPNGIGESIYGTFSTPDQRRLKMTLHRQPNDPQFTERDVRLLHLFHENLSTLYAAPLLDRKTPRCDSRIESLPPRLRPVLKHLLAGDAEKQVALKLGLSKHTVHQYTKVLYRSFDVNSRGELLAQFVVSE